MNAFPMIATLLKTSASNDRIWQYILILIVLVAGYIVGKIVQSIIQSIAKRIDREGKSEFFHVFLNCLAKPAFLATFGLTIYLAYFFNILYGRIWGKVTQLVIAIAITWLIYLLVDLVELIIRKRPKDDDEIGMEEMIIPAIRKTLRVIILIIAGLFIADNVFNQDIGTILAAAGIGGLAIALAAKETIENFFGSINIFADRPFKVGDRIKAGGVDGSVTEVGFRSTRIRTGNGHVITIPNSKIANDTVENISSRPNIKHTINLGLTYDTSPGKVEQAIQLVKDILAKFEPINNDPDLAPRVFFNEFKDSSLNIMVLFWFTPPNYWDFQEVNQQINLDIMRAFEENGIEFAFPTQTLYLKNDEVKN